ncbi:SsnA Cytosine deaminase [Pyrenophora tritici-repentis]|nr:5-methylthioadenosine/S-adenosylhomocysteine deaminase [Pyrenophora tritici-repentis]KAF7445871.1 5-methylthioadenosine/S-adenosylhomocysteine deaminase [Pyrenophora tritici-repentis]KAI1546801.1 SsnA Cytosine deaminase [Pyrenophora tritici-repentis]KAI1574892.1 SsnA Cytosine deaminase [Pyrenophora tritici-repentis]PZC93619.1 SsnA, Cytosine deaminase metal-dependent hydrolase [Pyrenophora tritici-repentis]
MTMPQTIKTPVRLLAHATVITVNKSREVILDGALLIENGRITALGKTSDLIYQLESRGDHGDVETIDCTNKIVIPGLINTHAHLAQSLLRGLAEDLSLHNWLCDAIWPLEANYAEDDGYVASMLTITEMLKTGTTCFLEAMLTHRSGLENVVRAVEETGIRACLGKLIKATESNPDLNMKDARDRDVDSMSVTAALAAHQRYHGSCDDRLHVWFSAGTPRGSPMAAHTSIGEAAQTHDIGLTMHCVEAPKDLTIYRDYYQCSPFQFCRDTKLTGPKSVFAHCVHPDPAAGDFDILRESKSTVSHNPMSNLKLGSGVAPIPDMVASGVNVALGTDGAPCNNSYDMFSEMHLASILHGGVRHNAGVLSAYDVLEFATINGARALGLEAEIGSLEIGKKADVVVVAPKGVACAPWNSVEQSTGGMDPVTVLVHSSSANTDMVIVDGQLLVNNGKLLHIDEDLAYGREVA